MSITWSREQLEVIETRNCNLLVSAAAGSGKTAVLVERIIRLITDPIQPVDVDRLLVVTFTKAAASELKERLQSALALQQAAEPDNPNLQRQASLIHHAKICTIDSFCLYVVQNHFGEIGLEPDFRIADQGEVRLLEEDVMDQLFEEEFTLGHKTLSDLCDAYAGKRSDAEVRDMVSRIYHTAQSCPWPREWMAGLTAAYACEDAAELMEFPVMKSAAVTLYRILSHYGRQLEEYLKYARLGLAKYVSVLEEDVAAFSCLKEDMAYEELLRFLMGISMPSLPTIRKTDQVNPELKEKIHSGRNDIKKALEELKKTYALASPEQILRQNGRLRPAVEELVRMALLFEARMQENMRRKRMLDFSAIEHDALQILVDPQTKEPTPTAREFARHFDEIMIDEYQDSNMVQEELLKAVSGLADGRHNMFMVGDVKQSIYRFRQARPELFMEKYDRYSATTGDDRKIELHRNFRSRPQVIDFANALCYKLMSRDLGNVQYTEEAALYAQAAFPEAGGMQAELLLLDKAAYEEEHRYVRNELIAEDSRHREARMAAVRIRSLMAELQVTDKKSGELRPVRYGDIVVLLRSMKDWGNAFQEIFEAFGIPVQVDTSTGYFDAYEVQTVLNMLRILDNPCQDIPMAAVLRSPLCGLSDSELGELAAKYKDLPFCMSAIKEMHLYEETEEGIPAEAPADSRLQSFAVIYKKLRRLSSELPIHELLQKLFALTGFDHIAASMPYGERRLANLDMLTEKAIAYEKTSYKGLFHFIRYIDRLQKYSEDFGEADPGGENADVVHLMTIHKSKGLEFPVVFLSGLGKKFNKSDSNATLVLHPDLGLGLREITPPPRLQRNSMLRTQISQALEQESLGEELRVLYVALTRAKEKLILTGITDSEEKLFEKYTGNTIPGQPLSYMDRRSAASYLDWIVPAVLSYPEVYHPAFADPKALALKAAADYLQGKTEEEKLLERIDQVPLKEREQLREQMTFHYPYADDVSRKSKYSVSELKHASMVENFDRMEGEAELPDFVKEESDACIPIFARRKLGLEETEGASGVRPGALRGTAVHRAMECLDFSSVLDIDREDSQSVRDFAAAELERMKAGGELPQEMAERIPLSMLERFIASPVALRMAKAAAADRLFREKPFVMLKDDVLVQGIIDVFWMEEDGIVLLDYKTDRIKEGGELLLRYQTQMELYAQALEKIFSRSECPVKVKEAILYSFHLKEQVRAELPGNNR